MKKYKDLIYAVVALAWCVVLAFPSIGYAINFEALPNDYGWHNGFNMVVIVISWLLVVGVNVVVTLPNLATWIRKQKK